MEDFLTYIHNAIGKEDLFKLTLSKPKLKNSQLRNVFLKPVVLGNELNWSATLRYLTNDKTQNFNSNSIVDAIEKYLLDSFYNADLFLKDKKVTLLQSKKGKSKVLVKKENHNIELETHDHQKNRLVPESSAFLKDLGISSTNGHVYGHAQDKFKQINKFVELLTNLIKDDSSISSIYDMGSGKGYLTFALHDYLIHNKYEELKTFGVEIREDLVQKCNDIAQKNNFDGLNFNLGSIEDYTISATDVVIALHACDIATDMAISKGIEANAKYIVVAPCCHKQIRKAMVKTNSKLNPLLKFGILKERQAEMVTDTIRALLMESKGYEVNVFEFISTDHTGKNVMLTAKKTGKANNDALQKINDLKVEFGIEYHYLEKLLN
jgi:hypothetical protein